MIISPTLIMLIVFGFFVLVFLFFTYINIKNLVKTGNLNIASIIAIIAFLGFSSAVLFFAGSLTVPESPFGQIDQTL